jgi:hypothetical protein
MMKRVPFIRDVARIAALLIPFLPMAETEWSGGRIEESAVTKAAGRFAIVGDRLDSLRAIEYDSVRDPACLTERMRSCL